MTRGETIYIDPKSQIAGYPALKVRKLLYGLSLLHFWAEDDIRSKMQVTKSAAHRILLSLKALNYVEFKSLQGQGEGWETTLEGNALAHASAAKPITRATANRAVAEFLDRVKVVNADPFYLHRIKKAVVFGSFLSNKERINDVDLDVVLERKEPDVERFIGLCRKKTSLAILQGKIFRNYSQELGWPEEEVLLFLKSRSRAISLHQEDQILQLVESRTLFDESSKTGSGKEEG